MIRGVNQVVLPVDDQERAKRFWAEVMGFEVVEDAPYGDGRWIAVLTPDGHTRLVLNRRNPGQRPDDAPASLPNSNVMFYSDDIQATYRQLSERGVRFLAAPRKHPFGWWSMFEDTEGNRYALGETWGTSVN